MIPVPVSTTEELVDFTAYIRNVDEVFDHSSAFARVLFAKH